MLARAASDPEYALSAHFALGASYQELGQLKQAAQEYEQTIRLVDLQSIGKAEADDLIQMYESAAQIYTQLSDIARAASLYSTLANFLNSKRWGKERADEFRRKAKELTERNMFAKLRTLGTGALTMPEAERGHARAAEETMPETWGKIRPITDFPRPERWPSSSSVDIFAATATPAEPAPMDPLAALDSLPAQRAPQPLSRSRQLDTTGLDEICERYVVASEKYIEQRLMLSALDACMEVIRLNPDYLPIHLRMGEIYEREGRPEEALTKYQLLIDTYMVRNEPRPAIDVYRRLIELSPDTINARSRLAELLKNDGRTAEAAEQIALVAATYFRMGQTNKALEEYRRGVQWAPDNATLRAQYGQALLKLERYEAALGEFRRALELDQNNLAGIARVNMTLALMDEQPAAIWQSLATLLEQLKIAAAADVGGASRVSIGAAGDRRAAAALYTRHSSAKRRAAPVGAAGVRAGRWRCWPSGEDRAATKRCWFIRPWPTAISRSGRPTRRWRQLQKGPGRRAGGAPSSTPRAATRSRRRFRRATWCGAWPRPTRHPAIWRAPSRRSRPPSSICPTIARSTPSWPTSTSSRAS